MIGCTLIERATLCFACIGMLTVAGGAFAGDSQSVDSAKTQASFEWRHPIKKAVHSLAVDPDGGKVAALGSETWIREKNVWRAIAIPESLQPKEGDRDEVRIFFGRDNQPRIMGTRFEEAGPRPHYLRFRHGVWKRWPRELAAFSRRPHAAIYGVLGWNDPEVLCKIGLFCLIKQRRGWSKVPLPLAEPRRAVRIDLAASGAYALRRDRLLRLTKTRWVAMGPIGPWQKRPHAAWFDERRAWVTVPEELAIYVLDRSEEGATWTRVASPVGAPHGLWATPGGTLWLAGSTGAAYFDGARWHRVAKRTESLREVIGLGGEIWFAGPTGVYRGRYSN